MKKYCFISTGNQVWIDVAIEWYVQSLTKRVDI
jgi:hypothetical protein